MGKLSTRKIGGSYHTAGRIEKMNLKDLIRLEPKIGDLKMVAEFISVSTQISWDTRVKIWRRVLWPQMYKLVGFEAANPALRDPSCYLAVYYAMEDILDL
jgi:hypothetical protein